MKYLLAFTFLVAAHAVSAQQMLNIYNDNQTISFKEVVLNLAGQNVEKEVYYKDGSPYFKENWLPASLILSNGESYKGLQAKLNILSGKVVYKNEAGTPLVAQAHIQQIAFTDSGNHFVFVNSTVLSMNGSKDIWYQQLDSGVVMLYKQLEKVVVENTPFNSATVEKSMKTKEKYFLLKGYTLVPIKKTKDLIGVLNDQPAALQKINTEKQSLSEKTLQETVRYYNSLSN